MDEYLIVTSIDIGTTKTACGFSTRNDFENNPLKVNFLKWEEGVMFGWKTPSCILFDKQNKFHSYGYEAEEKYAEVLSTGKRGDWFYFRQFKNKFQETVTDENEYILESEDGKAFPAKIIITSAFRYLKEKLLSEMQLSYPSVENENVKWVITVPAMWSNKARMFFRECASEAGIQSNHLAIAMESEAAALYVNYIEEMEEDRRRTFQSGLKYLICDIGGKCTIKVN
ncbi:heat shock 70 kDa protein 12B-like [Saccostrea cucullata]|uniref:heat shock 70 kDa protein 12B-like n=1 Tax=Saccostrea cuccullata TaxID=36930 RepID=UPI002ED34E7E